MIIKKGSEDTRRDDPDFQVVHLVNYDLLNPYQQVEPRKIVSRDLTPNKSYLKNFMQRQANRINLIQEADKMQLVAKQGNSYMNSPTRNDPLNKTLTTFNTNTIKIRQQHQKHKEITSGAAKRLFLSSVLKKQECLKNMKGLNLEAIPYQSAKVASLP